MWGIFETIIIKQLRRDLERAENMIDILNQENQKLMDLIQNPTFYILRTYHPDGVNGDLLYDDRKICHTIELPWRDNQRRVSCIPEGRYELRPRESQKFDHHIWIAAVPDRQFILFHPANNAAKELNGCIAPVTTLGGPGIGGKSRLAMNNLMTVFNGLMRAGKTVYLEIENKNTNEKITSITDPTD